MPHPWSHRRRDASTGAPTLVVGAGVAGRAIAEALQNEPSFGLSVLGFLDDEARPRARGRAPVLGRLSDLRDVAARTAAEVLVVAIPSLGSERLRQLGEEACRSGLSLRYLPSFTAALERDVRVSDLRSLQLSQLIGRHELHVVGPAVRSVVEGRRVLVTGAGGSIGSELCRQLGGLAPSHLFMLDHDESNLHRLQLQLSGAALLQSDELIIADIRDAARVEQVFRDHRPEVVFHAAAHKHLPLLEQHPCEGVKSNVLGTEHLVDAALAHGTERFILVSTDKAADPTSVLGATKRLAEMVLQANAIGSTRFASVRFGNVLGSRGSFLHVLSEQVANHEAVTVTHPDVTRYFMTVEEAVGLVLEAAVMAEYGEIFVLDMGEPVRIVDLVRSFAEQTHARDVDIRFTGLRPGEKLNEALFSAHEQRVRTVHPKISATLTQGVLPHFRLLLDELYAAAAANDRTEVRRVLTRVIPEYTPPAQAVAESRPPALATPYPDGF